MMPDRFKGPGRAPRLRDVKIGLVLAQSAADGAGGSWSEIASVARQAEEGGLDSLWLSDHFFYREADAAVGSETGYHEAWTLLSALAVATTRVELGTLVLATSFRPPGLLAKMAATADDIAEGRLILGLGCGWHEPEYEAFGYPFDHRVGRFEEALQIIVPLIRGERVTVDGQWSRVHAAAILPPPIRPALPILVAAKGERMLRLTARYADAWQTAWFGLPDERYGGRHAAFLAACAAEGRDPATLGITVGVSVDESPGSDSLPLDAAAISDAFAAWAAEGIDHLQLGMTSTTPATVATVIDAVARYRAG
jgi:FMNH2-dependent dimethyl sulfone monooxygenase